MKRLVLLGSFAAVVVVVSCGRSVDLGGKHDDEQDGGAAGHDDGTGGFSGVGLGGDGFGAFAGDASAGTGGDGVAGAGLGGNSFGGTAGDGSSGAGLGGNSFGGTAGDGSSGDAAGVGIGGAAGSPIGGAAGVATAGQAGIQEGPGLPTCITDLYAACWPEGPCTNDDADSTRCFESGAKIVREPVPMTCSGSVWKYYKPDGSLCFSYLVASYMAHACEDLTVTWSDANGTLVAAQNGGFGGPGFPSPTCANQPTIPCNPSTARCTFVDPSCSDGECN